MKARESGKIQKINQVYNAVASGCQTSTEVWSVIGMSVKLCSAYLSRLERIGRIRRVGTTGFPGAPPSIRWETAVAARRSA